MVGPNANEVYAQRQTLSLHRGALGRQEGEIPALGKLRNKQIIKKETQAQDTKQDPLGQISDLRLGLIMETKVEPCWLN